MASDRRVRLARLLSLGVAVLAYFVVFPADLAAIVEPLKSILGLSQSIATGLYVLIAVVIVTWVAVRIWTREQPRWQAGGLPTAPAARGEPAATLAETLLAPESAPGLAPTTSRLPDGAIGE